MDSLITEILQTVELEGKQAELYESIRLAMDKRVREANEEYRDMLIWSMQKS